MKKIIPLFLTLGLTFCLPATLNDNVNDVKADETNLISTYLVLTENGLYEGEKGTNIDELFLENTIKYEAEAGTPLPGADVVTNTVSGVQFNGWLNYQGLGVPTGYTEVPDVNETILYASWIHDGSEIPGGGEGGGEVVGETMRVYFKSPTNWTNANIYAWNASTDIAEWPGLPMNKDDTLGLWYFDYNTVLYPNVIFNNGKEQSADLLSPTDENADCYVWDNGWYNEDTEEVPPVLDDDYDYYLIPNNWTSDNAWFSAWVWGGGDQWVKLNKITSNLYGFDVPTGTTGLLFVRNNPAHTTMSWDAKWNQTKDLTLPTDGKNCYEITGWGEADGSWITYTAQ